MKNRIEIGENLAFCITHGLLTLLCLILASCNTNCDEERAALDAQLKEAISHANGNTDAILELKRQYENRLSEMDCE